MLQMRAAILPDLVHPQLRTSWWSAVSVILGGFREIDLILCSQTLPGLQLTYNEPCEYALTTSVAMLPEIETLEVQTRYGVHAASSLSLAPPCLRSLVTARVCCNALWKYEV